MGVAIKKTYLNKLVLVKWDDAVGYVMEDVDKVKPAPCLTVGWLKKIEPTHIIVASSVYEDDDQGDYTCLPCGMITSVNLLGELEQT